MGDRIEDLIQGAAFTALSPWCDPDDERHCDAMADQVRDAVLTALADDGLLIVQTGCAHDFDPECARCSTLRHFRVDLNCINCNKPMGEHGPMAECYVATDSATSDVTRNAVTRTIARALTSGGYSLLHSGSTSPRSLPRDPR